MKINKVIKIQFCFSIILLILSISSFAQIGTLKKAIANINRADFSDAKEKIDKIIKEYPESPLGYFVNYLYFTNTLNPNYNIDSGYQYFTISINKYPSLTSYKDIDEACVKLEYCIRNFYETKEQIASIAYESIKKNLDISRINHFIDMYNGTKTIQYATILRDSVLFYGIAVKIENKALFSDFMLKYPNSKFVDSAQIVIHKLAFDAALLNNTKDGFILFANTYPNAIQVSLANHLVDSFTFLNDSIDYFITKSINTIDAYHYFLEKHPSSRFTNAVEVMIFKIAKDAHNVDSLRSFIIEFPNSKFNYEAEKLILQIVVENAKNENTLDGYFAILKVYPKTEYTAELKDSIESIFDRFNDNIAPIEVDNLYGYINQKTGEIIVQPKYDYCGVFTENLGPVELESRWGFVNSVGKLVIETKFEEVREFKNGYAGVRISNFWGLINQYGIIVLPCVYENIGEYILGRINVDLINGGWTYVDTNGRQLVNKDYKYCSNFTPYGLAIVTNNDLRVLIIDTNYSIVKSISSWDFNGSFLCDYIDNIRSPYFVDFQAFSKDLFRIGIKVGKKAPLLESGAGFLWDRSKDQVQFFDYISSLRNKFYTVGENIGTVSERYYSFYVNDPFPFGYSNFGIIDYDRKEDLRFVSFDAFSIDQIACVGYYGWDRISHSTCYNYTDIYFNRLNNICYDEVFPFQNGFGIVQLGRQYSSQEVVKYAHLSKDGLILKNAWYDGVSSFNSQFAVVLLNNSFGLINKNGEVVKGMYNLNKFKEYKIYNLRNFFFLYNTKAKEFISLIDFLEKMN